MNAANARAKQARIELGALPQRLAALETMTMRELREAWLEVFGYATPSHNHAYLRKKIAWRIQEIAEGGLSPRALRRIEELAPLAPIRHRGFPAPVATPLATPARTAPPRDARLPPVGETIRRVYKGATHEVIVRDDGFEYGGTKYTSLSAIAKAITNTAWNGLVFFGLAERAARKGDR